MIGKTISHYKILDKMGGGGMGVVYRAEDLKLKRVVALKFLPPEMIRDEEAKNRFINEARAASALQHNNICTVHEIDEIQDGQLFIAMDCYDGETLKEKIAKGPLPVAEAVDIAIQIAAGLSKAHEAGMVHRDVKPANIMITRDGVVKILDFGLAKLAGQTKVTKTGTTLGTVAYMSPEQAKGQEVDERSDIFSLGVVLYELLAGYTPFKGEHEAALLYEIVHEEPEPLSSAPRSDIPEALQQIVVGAMQKDAGLRYQKALEMKRDLEALKDPNGGGAARPRMVAPRRRTRARTRLWASLASLAVLIAVGVAALVHLRSSREGLRPNDLSMAIIDFRDLVHPDDAATAAGITNLVHVLLTESSPIRPISPEHLYDIRRRLFGSAHGSIEDEQVLEVARKAGSVVFLYAEIAGTVAEQYVTWRLVETRNGRSLGAHAVEGKTLAELANGIVRGVLPLLAGKAGSESPQAPPLAGTLVTSSEEAYKHYTRGMLALRKQGGESEGIAELEKAVKLDSTFALAHYQLAATHLGLSLSPLGPPREYAEKAWAHRDHLNNKDRMRLEAFRELLQDGRNIPSAMQTYREILARWPDDLETLKSLSQYLFLYWYFGEAVTVSEQGLALYPDEEHFGVWYQSSLSWVGRMEEALEVSLAFVKKHPDNATLLGELAQRYWEVGLPDSAEAVIRRTTLRADPNNWAALMNVAFCAYGRGEVGRAVEMLEGLLRRPDLVSAIRYQILYTGWGPPLVYLPAEVGRVGKSMQFLQEYRSYPSARKSNAAYTDIELLIGAGKAAEAVDMARSALKEMSTFQDSLVIDFGLIKALVAADSAKEARSVLSGLRKVNQNLIASAQKFTIMILESDVCLAEKDPEGALRSIRELEKLAKPACLRFAIRYRETLARSCWKSGRRKEAVSAYGDLLKVFGGHAISRYELGQVYEEMKRPADAKREYSKFLEMCRQADKGWPPVEDARKRLAAL